jgi:hypothetical protein
MAKDEPTTHVVEIRWDDVEALPTVFANHVVVTHASGDEFYLIFGEAGPPSALLRGERPSHIKIRPVAKIALSPGSMMRIAAAIQQNAANWQRKVETQDAGTN